MAHDEATDSVLQGQSSIFDFQEEPFVLDGNAPESEPAAQAEESENVDESPQFVFNGNSDQLSFVDSDEWWKEHWVGMPEFVQEDAAPWKSMYIHFRSHEDLKEFSEIVAQRITSDTPSIWYPMMPKEKRMHMGYVDES